MTEDVRSTSNCRRGSGLTPAIIEEEKAKGLNQSEIAKKYGVTRQAVSIMKRKYGRYSMTSRERVMEQFPWKVKHQQQSCSIDHRMRDHAEFIATGGKGMSRDKLQRLVWLYQRLERDNVVVEYDPALPPIEGAVYGGWRFAPREDSDGDLMIRQNEHSNVTDIGKDLWRVPQRWPNV